MIDLWQWPCHWCSMSGLCLIGWSAELSSRFPRSTCPWLDEATCNSTKLAPTWVTPLSQSHPALNEPIMLESLCSSLFLLRNWSEIFVTGSRIDAWKVYRCGGKAPLAVPKAFIWKDATHTHAHPAKFIIMECFDLRDLPLCSLSHTRTQFKECVFALNWEENIFASMISMA